MTTRQILFALTAALALHTTTARAVVITSNTTLSPTNTDYEDLSIIVSNCTLTLGGAHRFQSLQVVGSGQVTTDTTYGAADRRVNLTILGDVLVDAAAAINVSAKGYGSATGPGAVPGGGGGGHGGHGGTAVSGLVGGGAYGSLLTPTDLGSGGGNGYNAAGGWGGGAIQLNVGGTLTVHGSLLANGGNGGFYLGGTAGGGSGGSIYVTAGALAGNGVISANGGASTGGGGAGGAGGRIALHYTNSTFSGTWSASGGSAAEYGSGGAGTIFTQAASQPGDLLVDNANAPRATHTPISSPLPCNLTIANGAMAYPTAALTNGNLTVKSNSLLTTLPGQAGLNLTILSNAVIEAGGRVDVTGSGYAVASGPGAGTNNAGGGGHGGEGGRASALDAGGGAYDSFLAPAEFGSGGGNAYASTGGAGGGLIRMVVGQTLQVDGVLAANGANAVAGGGGGGGLHLTVGALTGQGVITANGGSSSGGGGGGGRIAIYSDTRPFSGSISAFPGTGPGQAGGAGTVYLQLNSQPVGDLLVDGGGIAGAFTPLSSPVACHVTLSNRARAYPLAALNFSSLHLATNTLLTHLAGQSNLHLTVQGDLVADAGSAIRLTGQGYSAVTGPGAGTNSSGAGHGGAGGSVFQGGAGGGTYGSPFTPTALGSGGGNGFNSTGGAGGGALRLIVSGRLDLNGELSANGLNGAGNSGGGGAGGSIWVTVDTLAGAGAISALGGGSVWGGGGGGGRIALYARDRAAFTGLATATSGSAVFPGYPGLNGTVTSFPPGANGVWGLKTHDPVSQAPTTMFYFEENGANYREVGRVTLAGGDIEADGLAMSPMGNLFAFQVDAGGGSRLLALDSATAVASVVGPVLTGRNIRGATFTLSGRLLAFDFARKELGELSPVTGLEIGAAVALSTNLNATTTAGDLTQMPDGSLLFAYDEFLYRLDPRTGSLAQLHEDKVALADGNIPYNCGVACAAGSEPANKLFCYEASMNDDVYQYLPSTGFARTQLFNNVVPSYNAGRGDLAALPAARVELLNFIVSGTNATLETVCRGGVSAGVQFTDDLGAQNWQPVPGTSTVIPFTEGSIATPMTWTNLPASTSHRFFRIATQ